MSQLSQFDFDETAQMEPKRFRAVPVDDTGKPLPTKFRLTPVDETGKPLPTKFRLVPVKVQPTPQEALDIAADPLAFTRIRQKPPGDPFATKKATANALAQAGTSGLGRMAQTAGTVGELVGRGYAAGLDPRNVDVPVTRAEALNLGQQHPLAKIGKAITSAAPETYPVSPEMAEKVGPQIGAMAGSFLPYVASGALAPVAMGLEAAGGQLDRFDDLKAQGMPDETAARQVINRGIASGLTQTAIFSLLPPQLRKYGERYITGTLAPYISKFAAGKISEAIGGGALGATSQMAGNVINKRPIMEGVPQSATALGVLQAITSYKPGEIRDVLSTRIATELTPDQLAQSLAVLNKAAKDGTLTVDQLTLRTYLIDALEQAQAKGIKGATGVRVTGTGARAGVPDWLAQRLGIIEKAEGAEVIGGQPEKWTPPTKPAAPVQQLPPGPEPIDVTEPVEPTLETDKARYADLAKQEEVLRTTGKMQNPDGSLSDEYTKLVRQIDDLKRPHGGPPGVPGPKDLALEAPLTPEEKTKASRYGISGLHPKIQRLWMGVYENVLSPIAKAMGIETPSLRIEPKLASIASTGGGGADISILESLADAHARGEITDGELAFILAHEAEHMQLGHQQGNLAHEIEADRRAVDIIEKAGFNKREAVSALRKIARLKQEARARGELSVPETEREAKAHSYYDSLADDLEREIGTAAPPATATTAKPSPPVPTQIAPTAPDVSTKTATGGAVKEPSWERATDVVKPYVENLRNLSDKELKAEQKRTENELNQWGAGGAKEREPSVTMQDYHQDSQKMLAVNKEIERRKSEKTSPSPVAPAAKEPVRTVVHKPGEEVAAEKPVRAASLAAGIHPKSIEKLDAALKARDGNALVQLLTLGNKHLRAIFTEETGVTLPKTEGGTRKAVREWQAKPSEEPQWGKLPSYREQIKSRLGDLYNKATPVIDAIFKRDGPALVDAIKQAPELSLSPLWMLDEAQEMGLITPEEKTKLVALADPHIKKYDPNAPSTAPISHPFEAKPEKPDPNIGRSWNSPYGKQTISAVIKMPSGDLYSVTTEGTGAERRYDVDRIEEVIKRNEHELTPEYVEEQAKAKAAREASAEKTKAEEAAKQQQISEIAAFTGGMDKMAAGRVRDTLLKSAIFNNKLYPSRKTFIEQSVKAGYTVQTVGDQRRFTSQEGGFFDQNAITKAGMDYAEYLLKSSEPQPSTTEPSPISLPMGDVSGETEPVKTETVETLRDKLLAAKTTDELTQLMDDKKL